MTTPPTRGRRRGPTARQIRRRRAGLLAVVATLAALVTFAVTRGSPTTTDASRPPAASSTGPHVEHRRHVAVHRAPAPANDPRLARDVAVPILTYHVVAEPPPGAPFPALYVSKDEFHDQVAALVKAGFHGVTLDEVRAHWTHAALLPSHPIVLTFDNGYRSQYVNARPVLDRVGWRADENLQLSGLPPSQGGLTRAQVRGLVADGWELDTQGFDHADLVAITDAQLQHEVRDARALIRHRYGVAAHWFCYPSGHYDDRVVAAVRAAGYSGSTTTVTGWARPAEDPFRLPRIRALRGTSGAELLDEIRAARAAGPAPSAYS